MTAPRNLRLHRLLPLCLLLASAGAFAEDHDVIPGVDSDATTTPSTRPTGRSTRAKPAGGGGDASTGSAHSPRWHSFLPGMFR